jgi:hypothetical protein
MLFLCGSQHQHLLDFSYQDDGAAHRLDSEVEGSLLAKVQDPLGSDTGDSSLQHAGDFEAILVDGTEDVEVEAHASYLFSAPDLAGSTLGYVPILYQVQLRELVRQGS